MCHHEYELQAYNSDYARQIYRSGGVLLWEKSFDDLHFAIVLTASPDNRHEGDLTVILSVNSVKLCRMSFCYLNANIFSLGPFMTMLISRNQTHRASGRDVFDRCFKQNSPQLFCLSAICGIALANGFQTIFAIKHDAQVAYEEPYDANFRNSYTTLWEKFQAVEIDRHVYMMSVPLTLRPVGLVSRAHRRRARNRRGNWEEIVHSACESIAGYRTGSNWAVSLLPARRAMRLPEVAISCRKPSCQPQADRRSPSRLPDASNVVIMPTSIVAVHPSSTSVADCQRARSLAFTNRCKAVCLNGIRGLADPSFPLATRYIVSLI